MLIGAMMQVLRGLSEMKYRSHLTLLDSESITIIIATLGFSYCLHRITSFDTLFFLYVT